jgi:hypothetical protein
VGVFYGIYLSAAEEAALVVSCVVCPLHTSRLAIHLTPATCHPEGEPRELERCFDTVSATPKDRLRCTVGLSKTV